MAESLTGTAVFVDDFPSDEHRFRIDRRYDSLRRILTRRFLLLARPCLLNFILMPLIQQRPAVQAAG